MLFVKYGNDLNSSTCKYIYIYVYAYIYIYISIYFFLEIIPCALCFHPLCVENFHIYQYYLQT